MIYALSLAEDNHILSAWVVRPNGNYGGMPIVDKLPDGNITDYRYIDGEYIYDPMPEPNPGPSTPTLEDRVDALEDVTDDMVLLMAELIGG